MVVLSQTEGKERSADRRFRGLRLFLRNSRFLLGNRDPGWCETRTADLKDGGPRYLALNIRRVEFEDLDGNIQGYAKRGGKIAVSPIAFLPHKTLFHEAAHALLHCAEGDMADPDQTPCSVGEVEAEAMALLCCESLGLPGPEFSRGYI